MSNKKRKPELSSELPSTKQKRFRFTLNMNPQAKEDLDKLSNSVEEIVVVAINTFLQVTGKVLDKNHDENMRMASQIIFSIANLYQNDAELKQILLTNEESNRFLPRVIQSLYEISAAMQNPQAATALEKYRNLKPKPGDNDIDIRTMLQSGNHFRVPSEILAGVTQMREYLNEKNPDVKEEIKISEEVKRTAEYLNIDNEVVVIKHLLVMGVTNYLRNVLQDHLAEMQVLFPNNLDKTFAYIFTKLGEDFSKQKIILPAEINRKEIAKLFTNSAKELKSDQTIENISSHKLSR